MPPTDVSYRLRKASDSDYPFVERLYVETMRPLLSALDAWNEIDNITLFKETYYNLDDAKIIVVSHMDVGWLQFHEDTAENALHQIHIEKGYRGRGIGTLIINSIVKQANRQNKLVTLSLVKGNPALNLYKRLGFSIISEDKTKLHMRTQKMIRSSM